MWRVGFGPAADQLEQLKHISTSQLFKALQKGSSKKPGSIDVADDYLKGFFLGAEEIGRQIKKKDLDADETGRI